jgi:Asp-tRNA(Asn)/Glu-tRNA(Gln) amidotransferase A subunit family amidase
LIALGSSLDQVGPVTRNVLDAAMLQDAIAGHDPMDATSLPESPGSMTEAAKNDLKTLSYHYPSSFLVPEKIRRSGKEDEEEKNAKGGNK